LVKDKTRFETMKSNVLKFARPRAAFEITEKLLEMYNR